MTQEICFESAVQTPIGKLRILADEKALLGIERIEAETSVEGMESPLTQEAVRQIEAYFRGERTSFDLPLQLAGTSFQRKVWSALQTIPYGCATSYRAIAQAFGNPAAARAVGGAVGKNPFLVVLPCHRVLASDGTLGGFALGLAAKKCLLRLEGIEWK